MLLADPLVRVAREDGERVAVRILGHSLTFAAFQRDVGVVAAHLHAAGVRPGDLLGVSIRQSVGHWCVLLALLRLGAASVSLTARAGAEVAALPGLAGVVSIAGVPEAGEHGGRRIVLPPAAFEPAPGAAPSPVAAGGAGATAGRVAFTSGSSGSAKPVLLDAGALGRRLAKTAARTGIAGGSVLWPGLAPDSAYGFTAVVATWMAGGCVAFPGRQDRLYDDLLALGVGTALASPILLEAVLASAPADATRRLVGPVIVAGGRLSLALRDALVRRLSYTVLIAYGTSETGGVTLGDAALLDRDIGAVGRPFPDVAVAIVDDDGREVAAGSEGWIRIGTDSTVAGYLGDPDASARHFANGAFLPGDRAVLAADGTLLLRGRPADTLNVGGVKVAASRIELAAREIDGVADAFPVVAPDAAGEGRLGIAVVATVPLAGVAAHLRAALPELPPFLVFPVAAIPRNAMGKVCYEDMQALQERARRARPERRPSIARRQ